MQTQQPYRQRDTPVEVKVCNVRRSVVLRNAAFRKAKCRLSPFERRHLRVEMTAFAVPNAAVELVLYGHSLDFRLFWHALPHVCGCGVSLFRQNRCVLLEWHNVMPQPADGCKMKCRQRLAFV